MAILNKVKWTECKQVRRRSARNGGEMNTRELDRAKRGLRDRIAKVRGDRSQRQFARDLGVFQQNVNRYESGTMPVMDFFVIVAHHEGVSLDWLITGKGSGPRKR